MDGCAVAAMQEIYHPTRESVRERRHLQKNKSRSCKDGHLESSSVRVCVRVLHQANKRHLFIAATKTDYRILPPEVNSKSASSVCAAVAPAIINVGYKQC